ncbi:GAF domain-containing protein [Chryseolinea lacunae]|uniref:GAF domain-containing protein n=1 Tax=Chryseolinea lacunae TaxID=2801331 RepID=A0ABS1L0M4_9BACT|nr:GAF domain-containing protein [Chryseolinea lacunae]MBL0745067.1 GAF domain-containing protein [Chryseolinea lacunae]
MAFISQERRLLVKFSLLVIIPVLLLLAFTVGMSLRTPEENSQPFFMLVMAVVVTAGYGLFAALFLRALSRRFEKVEEASMHLSEGKFNHTLHGVDDGEFNAISQAIHRTREELKNKTDFANQIGEGNLQASYQPLSDDDLLGHSLLKIKESLLAVKEEDRKRNWTTDGLARFVDVLRTDRNLKQLCDDILRNLIKLLRANQGTIFIINSSTTDKPSLDMQACYAFDRKKYINKTIMPGEGLIGQVYLEKQTMYLKEVPENFVRITSGLGDATPRFLLITPLKMDDDVVGTVELASFREFEKHEIAFVEKIGETIAHNIISFRTAEHTRQLLQESQEQAEHMRSQEEELRQNQEELQATQEEISRKYNELFRQLTDLNHQSKFDQLKSINSTKKRNVEYYFDIIRNQIITFSENKMVIDAMQEFTKTFHSLEIDASAGAQGRVKEGIKQYYAKEFLPRLQDNVSDAVNADDFIPADSIAQQLQYTFIAANPHPTGQKSLMVTSRDNSEYGLVHARYHPLLLSFLDKFGYYDIFLIDRAGNIVYSVFKEVDFGTNLITGRYSTTNFGSLVQTALRSTDKQFVRLVDFEPYAPSYNAPASFIACPICDGDEKTGALVFQMPINKINQILTGDNKWREDGLGESGETYMVGSDYKLRSISRDLLEDKRHYLATLRANGYSDAVVHQVDLMNTSILVEQLNLQSITNALNGETGTRIEKNSSGVELLNAYAPLAIPDVQWVILSSMKEEEASQRINELRKKG